MRESVPLKAAGDEVVVLFRNSDLQAIQKKVVERTNSEKFDSWIVDLSAFASLYDIDLLVFMLERGLKKDGAPVKVAFDDIDIPIHDLYQIVMDGFCQSMFGRSAKEQREFEAEQMRQFEAEAAAEGKDQGPTTEDTS